MCVYIYIYIHICLYVHTHVNNMFKQEGTMTGLDDGVIVDTTRPTHHDLHESRVRWKGYGGPFQSSEHVMMTL